MSHAVSSLHNFEHPLPSSWNILLIFFTWCEEKFTLKDLMITFLWNLPWSNDTSQPITLLSHCPFFVLLILYFKPTTTFIKFYCNFITNHQRNANQNHMRYHLTPVRTAVIKRTQITNVGEATEKRERWCTAGGGVNWCSLCGEQDGGSSKN